MEATTIDLLEAIFSHLGASDLKNCALVCKDWDDVIGACAMTMKKLKIGFHLVQDHISYGCGLKENRKKEINQSSDDSHRQNVEIVIRDGSLTQLPSFDRFNISQVKSLSLHLMSIGSIALNKVIELLSQMPLLQELTLAFHVQCTIDSSNNPVAYFNKLKLTIIPLVGIEQFDTAIENLRSS